MTKKKSEFLPLAYACKCFCRGHFHVFDPGEFFYKFVKLTHCF